MPPPRANGSPFSPDHPPLVCCNDFKGGSKARCPSSPNSSSFAISSTKNVTENHPVALVSTRGSPPLAPRSSFASLSAQGAEGAGCRGQTLCWCLPRLQAPSARQSSPSPPRGPASSASINALQLNDELPSLTLMMLSNNKV